ncbi:hypothetical protein [Streptomyces sp. NPDC097610]|uniref:hypothetical protein n=1 Tax=Streptomyces sp. NPDC097610 TaxID=3157227 RepID=UPI0033324DB0
MAYLSACREAVGLLPPWFPLNFAEPFSPNVVVVGAVDEHHAEQVPVMVTGVLPGPMPMVLFTSAEPSRSVRSVARVGAARTASAWLTAPAVFSGARTNLG